jgi:hypothetical protein
MILADIGRYVQERRQVTLNEIARHFDAQPDAVRGMLDVWINKGRISRQLVTTACGSTCQQCDVASIEMYTWGPAATHQASTGACPKN